nr:hypothetical protein [uncultured Desulfobacter sp.]
MNLGRQSADPVIISDAAAAPPQLDITQNSLKESYIKILAFNSIPRLKGNAATMLDSAINGARENGSEVEL